MRKIEKEVIPAFLRRESASCGNTHTDGEALYLFGNRIAWWQAGETMAVCSAGWPTKTTASRLSAVASAALHSSGRLPFFVFRRLESLYVEIPGGTYNAGSPVFVTIGTGWTLEELAERSSK